MSSIVEQLLILPRCGVCHKRFPVVIEGRPNPLFCEECERSFQRAMRHTCARCGAPFFSCVCMPAPLRRVGFGALVKLAPYSEDASDFAMRRIVLSLKRKRHEANKRNQPRAAVSSMAQCAMRIARPSHRR